ncbi:MAG: hypothetical protein ACXWMX_04615 [Candidatus Limnocylindrales bacterium]
MTASEVMGGGSNTGCVPGVAGPGVPIVEAPPGSGAVAEPAVRDVLGVPGSPAPGATWVIAP